MLSVLCYSTVLLAKKERDCIFSTIKVAVKLAPIFLIIGQFDVHLKMLVMKAS